MLARTERVWRVFYTAPRAEKACEERFQKAGLEVFLPRLAVVRQWSDRKKKVLEPLFPNYLFARVSERERLDALQVSGIVRCVAMAGAPVRVQDAEIESLQLAAQEPELLSLLLYPRIAVGDHVEVTEGPLRGLKGEVLRAEGETFLVIRVEAIRQAVRVRIPAGWVRTLPQAA